MQRWVTTLVGVAVVVFAIWVVARNFHPPEPVGAPTSDGREAGANDAGSGRLDAGATAVDDASPLFLSDLVANAPREDAASDASFADGTPVPPLPFNAPRQVRFGVVLVSYRGAQPSAGGGHPSSRSKSDASELADRLLAAAKADFHAAVQQGDPGSSEDVGQLKTGILEPGPEFILFTLPVGGVGGPVDTPRGFWIVKRLE
ncbi:MAG TPA: peptidylprolyl isomerase [Polyangiaceae bacterium]|jgi:hypothetical protein